MTGPFYNLDLSSRNRLSIPVVGENWKILKASTAGYPKTWERVGIINMKKQILSFGIAFQLISLLAFKQIASGQVGCPVPHSFTATTNTASPPPVSPSGASSVGSSGITYTKNSGGFWAGGGSSNVFLASGDQITFKVLHALPVMVGISADASGSAWQTIDFAISTGVGTQLDQFKFWKDGVNVFVSPFKLDESEEVRLVIINGRLDCYSGLRYLYSFDLGSPEQQYAVDFNLCYVGSQIIDLKCGISDADCDGASDDVDICPYGDDFVDVNPANGIPDACDLCANPSMYETQFFTSNLVTTLQTLDEGNCFSSYSNVTSEAPSGSQWASWGCGTQLNVNSFVEFRVPFGDNAIVGLSKEGLVPTAANQTYGLMILGTQLWKVEKGFNTQISGFTHPSTGNPLYRVEYYYLPSLGGTSRPSKRMRYFQNGTLVYTSPEVPEQFGSLRLHVGLKFPGDRITELQTYKCFECNGGSGRKAVSDVWTEESGNQSLIAYPNPFENTITLGEAAAVKIFDSYGRLVFFETETKPGQQIDMKRFAPGVYYLEAKQEKSTKRIKLNKL